MKKIKGFFCIGSKDSKPRLISFLNSILVFTDNNEITDLEIVDPYNLPKLKGMKDTFVDVKAVLSDSTTVIVLNMLADGMNYDEIIDDFPSVNKNDILACLAFAAERENSITRLIA